MRDAQLISPSRQKEWGWFAVANFFLGGAGTGLYLINYSIMLIDSPLSEQNTTVLHDLISLSVVALGLLCVAIEAGRPLRGYYIFKRLGASWISREMIAFMIFVPAVVLCHFSTNGVFNVVATVSALCLMIAQGFIVYSARAVTSWNTALMPFFFLSSGLASGAGVSLLLTLLCRLLPGQTLLRLSLLCVVFNLAVWLLYLKWYSTVLLESGTQALLSLRHFSMMFFVIVLGHIIPILLLLLLWQIQSHRVMGGALTGVFLGVSGIAIIIGVAAQKAGVVLFAGYTRKIALKY